MPQRTPRMGISAIHTDQTPCLLPLNHRRPQRPYSPKLPPSCRPQVKMKSAHSTVEATASATGTPTQCSQCSWQWDARSKPNQVGYAHPIDPVQKLVVPAANNHDRRHGCNVRRHFPQGNSEIRPSENGRRRDDLLDLHGAG